MAKMCSCSGFVSAAFSIGKVFGFDLMVGDFVGNDW